MDPREVVASFIRGGQRAEDARNYNEWVKNGGFKVAIANSVLLIHWETVERLDDRKSRIVLTGGRKVPSACFNKTEVNTR